MQRVIRSEAGEDLMVFGRIHQNSADIRLVYQNQEEEKNA
jgi:hypothetical protein